jgi:hypothetical protein
MVITLRENGIKSRKLAFRLISAWITPEGNTDLFSIDTGVLQGDPLAPFLFIACLDYAWPHIFYLKKLGYLGDFRFFVIF